jgi:hypothetical protein
MLLDLTLPVRLALGSIPISGELTRSYLPFTRVSADLYTGDKSIGAALKIYFHVTSAASLFSPVFQIFSLQIPYNISGACPFQACGLIILTVSSFFSHAN